MEAGVCCTCTDDHASSGVGWLLFSLFCVIIAGYAFFAAFIAVQIWLAATILLRLCEGKYVRAALWCCVLAFLVNIDADWF
jgi:hypothetical protein